MENILIQTPEINQLTVLKIKDGKPFQIIDISPEFNNSILASFIHSRFDSQIKPYLDNVDDMSLKQLLKKDCMEKCQQIFLLKLQYSHDIFISIGDFVLMLYLTSSRAKSTEPTRREKESCLDGLKEYIKVDIDKQLINFSKKDYLTFIQTNTHLDQQHRNELTKYVNECGNKAEFVFVKMVKVFAYLSFSSRFVNNFWNILVEISFEQANEDKAKYMILQNENNGLKTTNTNDKLTIDNLLEAVNDIKGASLRTESKLTYLTFSHDELKKDVKIIKDVVLGHQTVKRQMIDNGMMSTTQTQRAQKTFVIQYKNSEQKKQTVLMFGQKKNLTTKLTKLRNQGFEIICDPLEFQMTREQFYAYKMPKQIEFLDLTSKITNQPFGYVCYTIEEAIEQKKRNLNVQIDQLVQTNFIDCVVIYGTHGEKTYFTFIEIPDKIANQKVPIETKSVYLDGIITTSLQIHREKQKLGKTEQQFNLCNRIKRCNVQLIVWILKKIYKLQVNSFDLSTVSIKGYRKLYNDLVPFNLTIYSVDKQFEEYFDFNQLLQ